MTVYRDVAQGSPEWHDLRRGIVTASSVGQLLTVRKLGAIDFGCPACGVAARELCQSKRTKDEIKTLHPERAEYARSQSSATVIEPASNDNSRRLTLTLAAERINGFTVDGFTTDAMYRGILDEPIARDLYSKHYEPVTEVGFMVESKWGFRIGASPDGLVGEDGVLEIKSRLPHKQLDTILAGTPPMENFAQLQCLLLVTGRKWVDYVSFAGGMKLYRKRVYPQRQWFDAIVGAVLAFEENAREITRQYAELTEGMPDTERTPTDMEIQI